MWTNVHRDEFVRDECVGDELLGDESSGSPLIPPTKDHITTEFLCTVNFLFRPRSSLTSRDKVEFVFAEHCATV